MAHLDDETDRLLDAAREHAVTAESNQTLALVCAFEGLAHEVARATEALHQLRTAYERTHQ
jgi:hypothetical protein